MTEIARPNGGPAPVQPVKSGTNRLNLTKQDYQGVPSTLCKGCGHDAITASISVWVTGY